jgi:hypothetical protein
MMKLLKRDFYSVLNSRTTLILLCAMLLLSIGLHSFNFQGSRLTLESSFSNVRAYVTNDRGEKYESFEDYWVDLCRKAIPDIFSGSGTIMLYAMVFAPFFITSALRRGHLSGPIFAGMKRSKILLSKILSYYIVVCILVQLGILTSLTVNRFYWWQSVTALQMLQVVGVRLLLDLAMLSITVAVAVSFGGSYRSIVALFLIVVLPSIVITALDLAIPFVPWGMYSYHLFANIIGIAATPNMGIVIITVVSSLVFIVASSVISLRQFNKMELRVVR